VLPSNCQRRSVSSPAPGAIAAARKPNVCHELTCGGIRRDRAWSDKPRASDKRIKTLAACKYLCIQIGGCKRFQFSKARGCSIYETPPRKNPPTFKALGVTIGTSEPLCTIRQTPSNRPAGSSQWVWPRPTGSAALRGGTRLTSFHSECRKWVGSTAFAGLACAGMGGRSSRQSSLLTFANPLLPLLLLCRDVETKLSASKPARQVWPASGCGHGMAYSSS
jgi:hypothetical protein